MCAQGCLLIRERARGRRHLRPLACAHDFYSCKMLQELLPTEKQSPFKKATGIILSSFRKNKKI